MSIQDQITALEAKIEAKKTKIIEDGILSDDLDESLEGLVSSAMQLGQLYALKANAAEESASEAEKNGL